MFEKPQPRTSQSFLDMFLRYLDGSILPAGPNSKPWARRQKSESEQPEPTPEMKDDPFRR